MNNYLAALKKVNILMGAEIDFMTDIESSMLKQSLRKILGENGNRKGEITIDILSRLCKVLDDSIPLHACMKALFLVALFSFLRKSNLLPHSQLEAAGGRGMFLWHQNVTFKTDNVLLHIYRTKTLLFKSKVLSVPIPAIPGSNLCPRTASAKHLEFSPALPGVSLFNVKSHSGYQTLLAAQATNFLKECISFIGLDESRYSLHSFRRGGASFAFCSGASPQFVKAQGDCVSDAYLVYLVITPQDRINVLHSITARLAYS